MAMFQAVPTETNKKTGQVAGFALAPREPAHMRTKAGDQSQPPDPSLHLSSDQKVASTSCEVRIGP
jgi:hypothetical protein